MVEKSFPFRGVDCHTFSGFTDLTLSLTVLFTPVFNFFDALTQGTFSECRNVGHRDYFENQMHIFVQSLHGLLLQTFESAVV